MTWRKHFKPVKDEHSNTGSNSPFSAVGSSGNPGPATSNYSSHLPDVYIGSPNRVERYGHYNVMDLDSEVNAGLDILAEFCTQKNKQNGTTFAFSFNRDVTSSEITILSQYLKQWFKLQKFKTRMFQIVRNAFKYGDEIFIRDPETKKLYHIDMANVRRIIVNESEGKIPEQYVFANINFNFTDLVASSPVQTNGNVTGGGTGYLTGGVRGMVGQPNSSYSNNRFTSSEDETIVDAKNVVHISLSEGLDNNYPFGTSLLETVFKVYKQKELLEDAIIIYRVQRAPERRVFYVDVGNMPSHLAMQFVERVKTEIHQRRIPSRTGGQNYIDSSYNPLCLDLNTIIPLLDGRNLPLYEIINLFESGEQLWTYSCNPITGKSAPGKIDWAGTTRTDAEVIKLQFDNGKSLICTPDHKFPVYNQGVIQAENLDSSCALFAFEPNEKSTSIVRYVRVNKKTKVKNMDTGTLTIDVNHDHHDYHTFAVDAGVYVKNSINEDFFFPQTCLSLSTQVKLLDERMVTIGQLISEYEQGKTNWVYSLNDKTHELEFAEIRWAGVTRKNTQVLRVSIDNGENVIATPDHIFIMRDGNEIEAQYLKSGDSLMSVDLKNDETHNVVGIEWLEEKIDTGDITINGYSNSHWFALGAGIYVHNSEGRGSKVDTLPGGCFSMDTMIDTLEGNSFSISEIEDKLKNGDIVWVYSCNPTTGEIVPGIVSWAGVTQQRANVMKLTLENGEEIICTPEHKFPQYDNNFKRADEFEIGDRFISSYKGIKLDNIEYLDDQIEVGTLTIDQDEVYHDYHTFKLTAGVFTKNSSLGEIDDLKYFTNKLVRGLRIPSSYLPTGTDDGTSSYNDGRVGTAYIQELRFNNYCERLQGLLIGEFDTEFKRYLLERGVNIDTNMFELVFEPPQNFASYRQAELDNSRVPTFTTMSAIPFISNRFALKRFLGLSDEEIADNEAQWKEENADDIGNATGDGTSELRGAGVSSAGMDADMGELDQELPADVDDAGMEMDDNSMDDNSMDDPAQTPPDQNKT